MSTKTGVARSYSMALTLAAKVKLAGQIVTALLVYTMGLNIEKFSYPGATGSIDLGGWSLPVTVFWLIAVVLIVGALNFLPALALGPVVEYFMMIH